MISGQQACREKCAEGWRGGAGKANQARPIPDGPLPDRQIPDRLIPDRPIPYRPMRVLQNTLGLRSVKLQQQLLLR